MTLQFAENVVAHLGSIFHVIVFQHNLNSGECGRTAEMVASKCGAEHTKFCRDCGVDHNCTHGETVCNALSQRNDVGFYARMLMREKFARASVAALNLVDDEERTVLGAEFAELGKKLCCGNLHAANALDAFDDYGGDITVHNFLN